jgi:hypothetical protein
VFPACLFLDTTPYVRSPPGSLASGLPEQMMIAADSPDRPLAAGSSRSNAPLPICSGHDVAGFTLAAG